MAQATALCGPSRQRQVHGRTLHRKSPRRKQKDHANDADAQQDAQGFGYGIVAVDAQHPQTLLASTIDRWHPGDTIFRSADGGAHWQSLKEGAIA